MSDFPRLEAGIGPFLRGELSNDNRNELKRLLCADCDFFTPGEDEELECSCYKILAGLIIGGHITLEQPADAVK